MYKTKLDDPFFPLSDFEKNEIIAEHQAARFVLRGSRQADQGATCSPVLAPKQIVWHSKGEVSLCFDLERGAPGEKQFPFAYGKWHYRIPYGNERGD